MEHACAAAAAGADWIGLVFAPSRRQVTPEQASTIVWALRQHHAGPHVAVAGLFVNEQPSHINAIAHQCGLDYVQLAGDETPDKAAQMEVPVLKTVRLDGSQGEQAWLAHAARNNQEPGVTFAPCPLIVDAHVPGSYGGTGTLADWSRAADLARTYPLMLAGGLNPTNVAQAIKQVRPWGVDVSSGVERDGTKDVHLIESFIRAVHSVSLQ